VWGLGLKLSLLRWDAKLGLILMVCSRPIRVLFKGMFKVIEVETRGVKEKLVV
jgi:hypothetical protein